MRERQWDFAEIQRLWAACGAELDVDWKDAGGMAPLQHAAIAITPSTAPDPGLDPQWWVAIERDDDNSAEMCRFLVATCGADVNCRNANLCTALALAASSNRVKCVAVLLELGADASLRTASDLTALDIAREKGHEALVALLEGAGTTVKSANKV